MSGFEKFLNSEASSEPKKDFAKVLEPDTDFLPGSLLVSHAKALKAAQNDIDKRIRKSHPGVKIEWDGTIGTARKDGATVDRIEIHGATYSEKTGEIAGVRFDATGIKLSKED